MPADAAFEDALQALLDGRPLEAGDESPPTPTSLLGALQLIGAVGDVHRVAMFGEHAGPPTTAPARWGPLEIREEIGRGASGTVYLAWDPRLSREVALKLFDRETQSPDTALAEGRLLARLRHPHIVTVFGAETYDGTAGMWMELLRGETLDALIDRDGVLGAEEGLLTGLDVASALSAVHAEGLLHRDVKARNVVRERGGRIVLMDLGAARHADQAAQGGDTTGTPLYMAPEVMRGGPATPGADLYGLGVLLFRLLTATYPVTAADVAGLALAHSERRRTPLATLRPDLAPEVVATVERCCHPQPDARFASAGEAESALQDALRATLGTDAPVVTSTSRTWARWKRLVTSAAATLAAALALVTMTWDTIPARAARRALGLTVPPRSPLYLTIGGAVGIVRGRRLELLPHNSASASPLAVSPAGGIRTLAGMPPWTGGSRFDLDGTPRRSEPAAADGLCCFYDGTTDGRYNYAIRQDSTLLEPIGSRPVAPPALYRFALDWSAPEPLFPLSPDGMYHGVAYSAACDCFWVTRLELEAAIVERWSRGGDRLGQGWRTFAPVTGLAVDPADGTLWAVQMAWNAPVISMSNYDADGRYLGALDLPRPLSPYGAGGAEFAWIDRRP